MKTMTKFIAAAAAAVALSAASGASALVLTPISQTNLDTFATSAFAGIEVSSAPFADTFSFTTTGLNDASSFVGQISLAGAKDIDFSAIDLDGLFDFVQTGFDPNERWDLASAVIGAGTHYIHVHGVAPTAGPGLDAASYSGTLNLSAVAVPEPATWGLMIMGFGGMGAVLRRRRQATAFA